MRKNVIKADQPEGPEDHAVVGTAASELRKGGVALLLVVLFPLMIWALGSALLWVVPAVDGQGGPERLDPERGESIGYAVVYDVLQASPTQAATGLSDWPTAADRVVLDTSYERRAALGIGMLALVALVLAIPFLQIIERAVPVRVALAG